MQAQTLGAGRARALAAGLALLSGLAVPALAASQALADSSPNVYVTNINPGNVPVVGTAANAVTATVPVGSEPAGVAVAPAPAGKHDSH
jgi:YVTN family beta-propeller protein